MKYHKDGYCGLTFPTKWEFASPMTTQRARNVSIQWFSYHLAIDIGVGEM